MYRMLQAIYGIAEKTLGSNHSNAVTTTLFKPNFLTRIAQTLYKHQTFVR